MEVISDPSPGRRASMEEIAEISPVRYSRNNRPNKEGVQPAFYPLTNTDVAAYEEERLVLAQDSDVPADRRPIAVGVQVESICSCEGGQVTERKERPGLSLGPLASHMTLLASTDPTEGAKGSADIKDPSCPREVTAEPRPPHSCAQQ